MACEKTQFDAWMKRAIEQKVVKKEPRPGVLYSLNQQTEHTSRPQEPSGSSDLYEYFIQSLQEQLANEPVQKSKLKNYYNDLLKTQFDAWMNRAIEQNRVTKELRPVRLNCPVTLVQRRNSGPFRSDGTRLNCIGKVRM